MKGGLSVEQFQEMESSSNVMNLDSLSWIKAQLLY